MFPERLMSLNDTVTQIRSPGTSVLRLLCDDYVVATLWELAGGRLRPSELEQRLAHSTHTGVMRRLGELLAIGAVGRERTSSLSPSVHYSITEPGKALLEIVDASARWSQRWSGGAHSALRLLADHRTRTILLALARESTLRPAELHPRLNGVSRSAMWTRLRLLSSQGLLSRAEGSGGSRYELTSGAHHLPLTAMLAADWEQRWLGSAPASWPEDLLGMLCMLAPAVLTPGSLSGVCHLTVGAPAGTFPAIHLSIADGRVAPLPCSPECTPHVTGCATPRRWREALLHRHLAAVSIRGNAQLLAGVLAGMSAALFS